MINKMYALYEHIPQHIIAAFENEYDLEISSKPNVKVISLCIKGGVSGFELKDSLLSDYDSERNITDYFYRSAPAMTISPFPTLYISEEGMKLDGAYNIGSKDYRKLLRILSNNCDINPNLQGVLNIFTNNYEDVFCELGQYLNNTKKTPYILSIRIDGQSVGRSHHYNAIRENAAKEYYKDFYTLGDKTIVGRDLVCSLCLQKQEELWGYVSIYNFYTSKTDYAPIAGGFTKEKAHRNYPVCPECASKLKKLRPVVNKYFSFKFCGFDYLLIPEAIGNSSDNEVMKMIIDIMVTMYGADPDQPLNLKTRLGEFSIGERKKLVDAYTKEVFDILAQTSNTASYTMLFYAENNAEFKVLLTIESIFPSQFKDIYEAKEKAESHEVFQNLPGKGKGEVYDLKFRFDTLKEFLPIDSKVDGDFSKAFLEYTRNIFTQRKLSYSFIMQRIMSIIRNRFTNDQNYDLCIRKAFLILKFMSYLKIIDTNKQYMEARMTGKFADFFTEHEDFFDSSAKQSVFMVGVLSQYLMNIQLYDKGSAPFRKRLNGLKLNKDIIQRIFTEAREKLEQYGKNYYMELEQNIAELMVEGGMEKLSNDEISFFFTLGMSLNKKFKDINIKDQEDQQ
jgi:CRISPR-associated protein Csh1